MPSSEYIETCLLGAAIKKPELLSVISANDFMIEQSQILWRTFKECRDKYQTIDVDLITVFIQEETGQNLRPMIQGFLDVAPESDAVVEQHAKMLIDMSRKARLDEEVSRIADLELPVDEKISSLNHILKSVTPKQIKPELSMKARVREVIERIEELYQTGDIPGVKTGYKMFDQVTGGLQKQDLYILAARPSVGKTAFAVNLALSIPETAFVSSEQPASQIVQRMISIDGAIYAHKMRNPRKFSDEDWTKLTVATSRVVELNTKILDDPAPTIEEVSAWSMKAVENGSKVIIIDYLQRIKAQDRKLSTFDRISHVAQGMKELARTLDVPVIALAQINRQGATDPKMEHLKGSGDIEQEADMVAILDRDIDQDPTVGKLAIEKNRHGPIMNIPLHFEKETMKFIEVTQDYEEY